jgi:hypothetical protein
VTGGWWRVSRGGIRCKPLGWSTPSVPSLIEAMEAAYARGRGRSQIAQDFASQYGADFVFNNYWLPAMEALR